MSVKRFYSEADISQNSTGWQVSLDGRPIKTVKGADQIAPSEALARALAAEWNAQGEKIDPKSMPLRDMIDYALDMVKPNIEAIIEKILAYGETDTLLYRADPDEPLFAHQQEVWEPITKAFERRYDIEMVRVSGIVHRPQSPETMAHLRSLLAAKDPFALAALEMMASLAASLITALSTTEPDADALGLWQAASLEEEWQAELWGRDEEAEERRAKRQASFLKAHDFITLAGS